ncbi:MAG TPA: cell division protein FtsA [bacterium]|nr:cell division protein FtsA [bacterium]
MAKRGPLVGLDIGTTKVCVIIAEPDDDGEVHITGVGTSPSLGVRKGVVVDLDTTTRAIEEAVEGAERMAGVKAAGAVVAVSGEHIASQNSRGVVAVSRTDREIGDADVSRVVEAARMAAIPGSDREIIHLLPRDFLVDGQDGVRNPVGMYGMRLEVEAHIVTGASTLLANLLKCIQRAGLEVDDLVLEPLASGEAVLTQAERDLGVALVDIGGGTTSIGVFSGGSLCHATVLPVGGNHVTNDIAVGLRTPIAEAEKLKIRHGCAAAGMAAEGELIEVFHIGSREPRILPRRVLGEIIEPRIDEICGMIKSQLKRSGYAQMMPAGLVATGGGALLAGLAEAAGEKIDMPARVGAPDVGGSMADTVGSPVYATGVGLVLHAARQRGPGRMVRASDGNGSMFGRLRQWFREFAHGG